MKDQITQTYMQTCLHYLFVVGENLAPNIKPSFMFESWFNSIFLKGQAGNYGQFQSQMALSSIQHMGLGRIWNRSFNNFSKLQW
jgi:hypothetical protein